MSPPLDDTRPDYTDPVQAARLLLHRRTVRRDPIAWARTMGFEPAQHHRLIIAEMQALMSATDYDILLIAAPPGSAKSHYVSVTFPPWWLAQNPTLSVIAASHSAELAAKWGRRVRNIISTNSATLGVQLAADSQAADRWALSAGGEYLAAGVQMGIAGFRADLGIIDDPFGSRDDAYSERIRDRVWDWYNDDFSARLKPGAKRVVMACMVGDTAVLMADGTSKALRDIERGDEVATFNDGAIETSTVLNWANKGPDIIYEIKTSSGITVKANARHPFLVRRNGGLHWTRLRNLRIGDVLLSVTERGQERHARRTDAISRSAPKVFASSTTARRDMIAASGQALGLCSLPRSSTDTESTPTNTTLCWPHRMDVARSASDFHGARNHPPHGGENWASTIATRLARSEDCYATSAINSSDAMLRPRKRDFSEPLSTYVVTNDTIDSIAFAGREDVFDIEVAETENFIANGLASHNTRWHLDDLAGRILEHSAQRVRSVIIPAIAEAGDVLGREPGQYLWDDADGYNYGAFLRSRQVEMADRPVEWSALYQQKPVPEAGGFFKAEWIRYYDVRPTNLRMYGASDYAVTADGGDFTEHGVAGVNTEGDLYVTDWWSGQTTTDVWVDVMLDLYARHETLAWAEESGQIIKSLDPFIIRRCQERGLFPYREQFTSVADKAVRAQAIRGRMSMGKVYLPRHAPWATRLVSQLLSFPAGKHDDAVDVMGLLGRMLDRMDPAHVERPKVAPRVSHWLAA